MNDAPLLEITSHIDGKNAKVRVYPDRVEWERGKSVNKGLLIGTMGMSALAGPAGIMTRKGSGTEVIPMRSISSVTTRRDSMLNDIVSVITSGNMIDMRCSKSEAAQLKSLILQGINGTLGGTPAAPPAPAAAAPAPVAPAAPGGADEIARLAELHAAGHLTAEEFAAAKAKALGL